MSLLLQIAALALLAAAVLRLAGVRAKHLCVVTGAFAFLAAGVLTIAYGGLWQAVSIVLGAGLLLASTRLSRPIAAGTRARRIAGALGAACVAVAGATFTLPAFFFPVFEVPAPTGPHPVGTRSLVVTDAARPERWTDDPSDRRQVTIQVWYPAGGTDGSVRPYWPDAALRAPALAGELGLPSFVFSHLDRVDTNSIVDAPLAHAPRTLPVLVFSHGYAGSPDQSTFLTEDLASHGYVVVSVGHPYESLTAELTDGVAPLTPQTPEPTPELVARSLELMDDLRASDAAGRGRHAALLDEAGALSDLSESFDVWVADGRFALDWIELAAGGDGSFSGRIDPARVGVFGHSFGGAMAAEVCRLDERCTAGINIDGAQMGTVVGQGVEQPFLFLYSETSTWINHAVAERSARADQASILGSAHLDFTDLPRVTRLLRLLSAVAPIAQSGPLSHERVVQHTRALVRDFFDEHVAVPSTPMPDYSEEVEIDYEGSQRGPETEESRMKTGEHG